MFGMRSWMMAALLMGTAGWCEATELVSQLTSIDGAAQTLLFDFTHDADLGQVNNNSLLTGIRIDWVFAPGTVPSGGLFLSADLQVENQDSGLGFNVVVPNSSNPVTVSAVNTSVAGLAYSDQVIQSLLGADFGKLEGLLQIHGIAQPALNTFFQEGGQLRATLFLSTVNPNPVPEPSSLLTLSALLAGSAVWWRGRRPRRRAPN